MKRQLATAFLTLAVFVSPVWAQKKIEQIVARVNGDIILKSDIARELELRKLELAAQPGADPAQVEKDIAEQSKALLRDLIDRILLVQVAKEADVNVDLDVLKTMEQLRTEKNFKTMEDLEEAIIKDYGDLDEFKNDIRTKFLTQKVIEHEVYSRIVVTNEEMRKYYEEHRDMFNREPGVGLAEVVVLIDRRLPDQVAVQRKKIEEAMAALKNGDNFGEVAVKYSEVPSAVDGGELGFSKAEELHEDIAKAVEKLAKNEITGIVERIDAFEIYKVTDRHSGGILSFELAQKFIWPEIMGRLAPPKVREFLLDLRENGFVDVKEGYEDLGAPPKANRAAAK